jgi:hypothetical protein
MYNKGSIKIPLPQAFGFMDLENPNLHLLLLRLGRDSITRNLLKENTAMKRSTVYSVFENWAPMNQDYTCGREVLTVPFALAESGVPSPFLLVTGSFIRSVECLVSVFDKPSCLPDCVFLEPAGLEVAG